MYVQTSEDWRKTKFFREQSESRKYQPLADVTSLVKHDAICRTEYMDSWSASKSTKLNRKRTRRGGRRHKYSKSIPFSIIGNNVAGIVGKRESLNALLKFFNRPSCLTLQETKLGEKVKYELEGYQVYQKNRNSHGGGLLTAIDPGLDQVLVSDNEEAEILVTQVVIQHLKITIINAYAPQDDDSVSNKLLFWTALEKEILAAERETCEVLIQMDANSKVGQQVIPQNPHSNSDDNGRQLLSIIERHNLSLLNADRNCFGSITRYRQTKVSTERAILDYIIISQGLYPWFKYMKIDEERLHTVTKYASKSVKKKQIESDHNPLFARFELKYKRQNKNCP